MSTIKKQHLWYRDIYFTKGIGSSFKWGKRQYVSDKNKIKQQGTF